MLPFRLGDRVRILANRDRLNDLGIDEDLTGALGYVLAIERQSRGRQPHSPVSIGVLEDDAPEPHPFYYGIGDLEHVS